MMTKAEKLLKDYDPEVHDELRCGGGSFEDDFEWITRFHG